MKFKINRDYRDKIKKLKSENKDLKKKINLLKKYIVQCSITNKTLQVELFERTEELDKVSEIEDIGEII